MFLFIYINKFISLYVYNLILLIIITTITLNIKSSIIFFPIIKFKKRKGFAYLLSYICAIV